MCDIQTEYAAYVTRAKFRIWQYSEFDTGRVNRI